MNPKQHNEIQQCSAGTYASITGLRKNEEVAEFSRWISEKYERLPYIENALVTISFCWVKYIATNDDAHTLMDEEELDLLCQRIN